MMHSAPPGPDREKLLAPLAGADRLLLAVSGGPDSVALMLLASLWSLREERDIVVATVDHGLRPGSAEEARLVGEWARQLGFSHHVLRWEGEKPKTRIQERARAARYALLVECARMIGAAAIVTAHHADDQAETILFRLARGSGVAGLAGMAPIGQIDGLALLRPLLGVRKQELELFCEASNQPFLRDPSNENPAFARTRLRRLRGLLEAEGLDTAALLRLGSRAARAEAGLAWSAEQFASSLPSTRSEGEFRARHEGLRALPREVLQRIIAAEVVRIGGAPVLRYERLERAADKIADALEKARTLKLTLGGALIELRKSELIVTREAPRRRASDPPV